MTKHSYGHGPDSVDRPSDSCGICFRSHGKLVEVTTRGHTDLFHYACLWATGEGVTRPEPPERSETTATLLEGIPLD